MVCISKINMKTHLILIIILLISSQYSTANTFEYDCDIDTVNHIIYHHINTLYSENYDDCSIHFADTVGENMQLYSLFDTLFCNGEQLDDLVATCELPNVLFELLIRQDIINRWEENKVSADNDSDSDVITNMDDIPSSYKNKDEYLTAIRSNCKMYMIGNIHLNDNFFSKLILVCTKDDFHSIRGLYLLNIKDNLLKSLTEIAESRCIVNGNSRVYLSFQQFGNGIFSVIRNLPLETDDGIFYREIECYPHFYFDNEGYMQISQP